LVSTNKIRELYKNGWNQFAPFAVTIVAILFTDLLQGVSMGIIVALFFMIRSNFRSNIITVNNEHQYLVRLRKDISFLNKPIIKNQLEKLPSNSAVLIDTSRADFIDQDIIEAINEFREHAHLKNIQVEIKKNINNPMQDAL
jgi:MFS superfamily sulfate permease-like transporter